ncbi:MAG: homoserine dehydrogenase, partial [Endomicrobiia bacterium]
MKKKKINLGLIGLGNVGSKVVDLFYKNKSIFEQKIGAEVEFSILCDVVSSRFNIIPSSKKIKRTKNWTEVVSDQEVDIVIELIGKENIAKKIIVEAIKNNKNIVTANKAVLANNWDEIFSLAREKQKLIYFEGSVGAGIPIIQALNEGLAANRIKRIVGILNGTTNYILTKMLKENMSYKTALKFAQKNGFAEANPKIDVTGIDTKNKLSILSSIAWSTWIKPENIYCEGIDKIDNIDINFAFSEFNYVTKLLGIARLEQNKLELFVRPCLIPANHPFSNVDNEFNAILLEGDACGNIIFYGKGAGGAPAASAVLSDIMFLARQVSAGTAGKIPYVSYTPSANIQIQEPEKIKGCYYLRFTTIDKPGVLSKISGILAKYNVSIAGVFQKEPLSKYRKTVPILMLTHRTSEYSIKNAIQEIDKLSIVKAKTVLLR